MRSKHRLTLIVAFCALGVLLALGAYLLQRHVTPWAQPAQPSRTAHLAQLLSLSTLVPPDLSRVRQHSSLVLDRQGRVLRAFPSPDDTWRLPTRVDEVDGLYLAMLKASEDQRFDLHPGVDPLAMLRALAQALKHGEIISGASTLSMQSARLLQPKPRTWRAKLSEAARALQLSLLFGRKGVLEIYLTLAPFGGTVEGVQAASWIWFGHDASRLTPAEAALLVALPQSPERLRPDRNPSAAKKARDRILQRMVQRGVLQSEVAQAAMQEPLPRFQRSLPRHAAHLAERLIHAPGQVVHTWIDRALQQRLEQLGQSWRDTLDADSDLAVVVLDGHRLIAHLGSSDWQARQLDLSTAVRSPGSTLKPLIYALAFDDLALHPATLMDDLPQRFGDWQPRNFDQQFHGTLTAREALQRSLNIPAVQALERVGPMRFAALLQRCGARLEFPTRDDPGLPLALGGVGIRLMDLAMLYAGLGQSGRIQPLALRQGDAADAHCQLVGATAAYSVLDILQHSPLPEGVASLRGTQRPRSIAFKTGTSYGFRDAWTVGVSTRYTVAVWVGRADGGATPGRLGRVAAAPLMFRVFDLLPPEANTRPPPADAQHPLLQGRPPPALARLTAPDSTAAAHIRPLRILFPPHGSSVELVGEGIALQAQGGQPPLRWVINGVPLEENSRVWRTTDSGFAHLVVLDATGQRAESRIRVLPAE